jgi:hypothetical protein
MNRGLFFKNVLIVCLAVLFTLCLAACAAPAPDASALPEEAPAAPTVVVFADPVLEKMVRAEMSKPEGDITVSEAEAVDGLRLSIEQQPQMQAELQIKDISGLEHFKNLKILDLSFQNVSDISPLTGLTNLTSLSLGGNPVADIAPLSGMVNLRSLTLFNCAANDYSALSALTNLDFLMIDYSSITDLSPLSGLTQLAYLSISYTQVTDVSPLAGLTSLRRLFLAECPIEDYSPLAGIYPYLAETDFAMAASLQDLGFRMDGDRKIASFSHDTVSYTVNHAEWGIPMMELEADSVRMELALENGYYLTVGRYPSIDAYVFSIRNENEGLADYVYDNAKQEFSISGSEREIAEAAVRAALGDTGAQDVLLAPVSIFDQQVMQSFSMRADQLFALPFDRVSLVSLGFTADRKSSWCVYEQHEGNYISIRVNRPEWGGNPGWDIEYYTVINGNEVFVQYSVDDRRFYTKGIFTADGVSADFEYFPNEGAHRDGMVPDGMSVSDLFLKIYNDSAIDDPYVYTIETVQRYIHEHFGVNENDLYALPAGD